MPGPCSRCLRALSLLALMLAAEVELDPARSSPALGAGASGGRFGLATAVGNDGRIYALGGSDGKVVGSGDAMRGLRQADAYDPSTKRWTVLPPMRVARLGAAATAGADGRVYALGGAGRTCSTDYAPVGTNQVEAYLPSTHKWTALPPMPTPRTNLAAVTGADGRIYAIGGQSKCPGDTVTAGQTLAAVEAYDPRTGRWVRLHPLLRGRVNPVAVLGSDRRIYVLGGYSTSTGPVTSVETYSTRTNRWKTAANLNPPNRGFLIGAAHVNGHIFVLFTDGSIEMYDIAANRWRSLRSKRPLRAGASVVAGADGRIYVLGGFSASAGPEGPRQPLTTVDVYDPGTGRWSAAAPLPVLPTGPTPWRGLKLPSSVGTLETIACPGPAVCYLLADNGILKTVDGGATWQQPARVPPGGIALACPSVTVCYVVGNGGIVLATADGGATWSSMRLDHNPMIAVACPTTTTCIAERMDGLVRTSDGGRHWKSVAGTGMIYALTCVSVSMCYAAGRSGQVPSSSDAGATWTSHTTGSPDHLSGIACPSVTVCAVVGIDGANAVTTNGGNTWVEGTRLPLNMRGIACTDTLTCEAVGTGGRIMLTTNAGHAWSRENSGTNDDLASITCPSSSVCYVMGRNLVLKSG